MKLEAPLARMRKLESKLTTTRWAYFVQAQIGNPRTALKPKNELVNGVGLRRVTPESACTVRLDMLNQQPRDNGPKDKLARSPYSM